MVGDVVIHFDGFEWDAGNVPKVEKRVSISEVEDIFRRSLFIKEDVRRPYGEKRWVAVGGTENSRYLFVAFTIRYRRPLFLIRVISARYMHKKEQRIYENLKKAKPK